MNLRETTDEVESFRAKQFRHQRTFKTPLDGLPRFVTTFLSSFTLLFGTATIESVVFEPENLLALLARHSLSPQGIRSNYFMHVTIRATGQEEIASLLEAALGDWVDFTFMADPSVLSLFADHDEYTTFFSDDKDQLSILTSALVENGFSPVPDYMREF